MNRTTILAAGAVLALASSSSAWAQSRPILRLPSGTPPVSSQAGQPMPTVMPGSNSPQSANPQGAGTRATDMLESRIQELEGRIALLEAAMSGTQTNLASLRARFDGHRHRYRDLHFSVRDVRVVTQAHATGDDTQVIHTIDAPELIPRETEGPLP